MLYPMISGNVVRPVTVATTDAARKSGRERRDKQAECLLCILPDRGMPLFDAEVISAAR